MIGGNGLCARKGNYRHVCTDHTRISSDKGDWTSSTLRITEHVLKLYCFQMFNLASKFSNSWLLLRRIFGGKTEHFNQLRKITEKILKYLILSCTLNFKRNKEICVFLWPGRNRRSRFLFLRANFSNVFRTYCKGINNMLATYMYFVKFIGRNFTRFGFVNDFYIDLLTVWTIDSNCSWFCQFWMSV